jgi:hypothetical protein
MKHCATSSILKGNQTMDLVDLLALILFFLIVILAL